MLFDNVSVIEGITGAVGPYLSTENPISSSANSENPNADSPGQIYTYNPL